jgi:hypothetical protein
MIKIVKLKEEEIKFLKTECFIDILENYSTQTHYNSKSKSWTFLLNENELELISENLTLLLMNKGVTNGEINAFGKKVDDYIGKFNYYE